MTQQVSTPWWGHACDDQPVRCLQIVLGDQLDPSRRHLTHIDKTADVILMMEVADEATHVASHKQRTVLFLAAMRQFGKDLHSDGYRVRYVALDDPANTGSFDGEITRAVKACKPDSLRVIRPGEWRVLKTIQSVAARVGLELVLDEDPHFYLTPEEFEAWADGRKTLVMEHFYRMMRKRLNVLMTDAGEPEGGAWNFDKENRETFREDPASIPDTPTFRTGERTLEVIDLVQRQFPDAPGRLDSFNWPVTRNQGQRALDAFIVHRLPHFGQYQDAMVSGQRHMFHSLLSSALNLKLLDPRECVQAAVDAYEAGHAPINAVEGFVRQLIGWREFIRGMYWQQGPDYADRNAFGDDGDLPALYWDGQTDMVCLRESVGQVLDEAYGHHIQRLMVTGNFALLLGVHPRQVSDWYLGMYVDAVDWVTLPNTLGMAMYADGGVVGTKPYIASGRYINRMSDYCRTCPYDPTKRTGDDACPYTTLYWEFLDRHERMFRNNRRMTFPMKNLATIVASERREIAACAMAIKQRLNVIQ
jgi:deoxyribodipyrimidine photolyase-related protein